MIIKELSIPGVYEITLSPVEDFRGFFMRTYDSDLFLKHGLCREWLQENHSKTISRGTIRGLHFQREPYAETKLVRCIRGSVFDIAVDLRQESVTFGQWVAEELTEDNFKMLYIPHGCAHGFCTLKNDCHIIYKVDNYFTPSHELGLLWNDPDINIKWPVENPIISEKDLKNISFADFIRNFLK